MATFINDFLSLFFPPSCQLCQGVLNKNESFICTNCLGHLPYTQWHKDEANPLHSVFWGKVPLQGATAMLYFHKDNNVQKLMHQFKYKGVKELGFYIGKRYGAQLIEVNPFKQIDFIIPIPLHPKKLKSRGYNQSECFANGLSKAMKIEVLANHLYRKKASETQTRKSKIERWENVKAIFDVHNPDTLIGKHILLVDDVITTGSTMEACAHVLLEIPEVKISVAAIAAAHR